MNQIIVSMGITDVVEVVNAHVTMEFLLTKCTTNQCKINFISSQIRENRIEHEILSRELEKELKEFEEKRKKR